MTILQADKVNRKKYIKNIEKHLKNYHNYQVAITNLKKQLEYLSDLQTDSYAVNGSSPLSQSGTKSKLIHVLQRELSELEVLHDSIVRSLAELTELELRFVECRYFKNWSIEKSAMEIGYSDKALFLIRNQVMDKLLISLGTILYI